MESLLYSLGVALLGMVTVFCGLVILIAFITLLTKLTTAGGKKKPAAKPVEVKSVSSPKESASGNETAVVSAPAPVAQTGVSPEVVAAIAAALSVVMGEGRFVVKHIRRVSNAPAWNRSGREEQIYSRF